MTFAELFEADLVSLFWGFVDKNMVLILIVLLMLILAPAYSSWATWSCIHGIKQNTDIIVAYIKSQQTEDGELAAFMDKKKKGLSFQLKKASSKMEE